VPDFVTGVLFDAARAGMDAKRGDRPATLRFEPYAEGWSLQTMHIGKAPGG
jgi:hypothetical protein